MNLVPLSCINLHSTNLPTFFFLKHDRLTLGWLVKLVCTFFESSHFGSSQGTGLCFSILSHLLPHMLHVEEFALVQYKNKKIYLQELTMYNYVKTCMLCNLMFYLALSISENSIMPQIYRYFNPNRSKVASVSAAPVLHCWTDSSYFLTTRTLKQLLIKYNPPHFNKMLKHVIVAIVPLYPHYGAEECRTEPAGTTRPE